MQIIVNSHCWNKEYDDKKRDKKTAKRHANGYLPVKGYGLGRGTTIRAKVIDQDGDDGTDDDIEAMGECRLDLAKADAKGKDTKMTCTLKLKGKDAGTLEFLVTDRSGAEERCNKAAAPSPPKCFEEGDTTITEIYSPEFGKLKRCFDRVSRSVPV